MKKDTFKKGQMLIIGILFMAILLIFSTTIFTKVRYFINFGTNATIREQSRHVAEAGVDYAVKQISIASTYAGTLTDALPGNFIDVGDTGNFEITVQQPSPNLRIVTVTGYVPQYLGFKAKTTIQINMEPSDAATTDVLPQPITNNSVVVSNGYVYSLGGQAAADCNLSGIISPQFAEVEASGFLSPFEPTFPLPENRTVASGVEGASSYIYVIGGTAGCDDPGDLRSTVFYTKPDPTDGSIDYWNTATNPIPTPGLVQYAFFTGGYIYVIQDQAIYYALQDPITGEVGPWQTDSTSGPDDWPSYTFTNGYLYYVSGHYTQSIWYAQVTGGSPITTFTEIPDLIPTKTSESAITTANGFIYVIGGRQLTTNQYGNAATPVVKTVYYAPVNGASIDPFTSSPKKLPKPRFSDGIFPAAAINNKLFVFGGQEDFSSGQEKGNVWTADINPTTGELTNVWTDNGGTIGYSGWALNKATYKYK